jgi:hypothetical protein
MSELSGAACVVMVAVAVAGTSVKVPAVYGAPVMEETHIGAECCPSCWHVNAEYLQACCLRLVGLCR